MLNEKKSRFERRREKNHLRFIEKYLQMINIQLKSFDFG